MKKTTKAWVGIIALAIGAPSGYFLLHQEDAIEAKDVKKMSEKEQKAYLDKLSEYVSSGQKPSTVEKDLAMNIAKLSKDNASEAFYIFLYGIAIEQEKQMKNYETVSDNLILSFNKGEFTPGVKASYDKVEDQAVKGYLNELKRQFLFVEDDGQGLYLTQDVAGLEKKYGSFFNDGLKAVMDIRIKNQTSPYVSASGTKYNLKKNLERILWIQGKKTSWENTIYQEEALAIQETAYADFFGVTQDTYFEQKDGKDVMKESVKEEMWHLAKEYANSFMADDILAYMEELEADGFEKKDDQNVVYGRMNERFGSKADVQTPFAKAEQQEAESE